MAIGYTYFANDSEIVKMFIALNASQGWNR